MSGNTMKIVLGLVAITVSMLLFPMVLNGVQAIITDAHIDDYTGLESLAKIAPLIIFVGMFFTGGFLTFQGVKGVRTGSKNRR